MEDNFIFNAAWKKYVEETWTNCLDSITSIDILINKVKFFMVEQNSMFLQEHLHMILLSMYNDHMGIVEDNNNTPIKFECIFGMEQLNLKQEEYNELGLSMRMKIWAYYSCWCTWCIFDMTAGHPNPIITENSERSILV